MANKSKNSVGALFAFIICGFISASFLSIIQAPFNVSWLAWIALVPVVIGIHLIKPSKLPLIIAWLVLGCFWIINLYWISYVTTVGWITFSLFSGIYWPLLMIGIWFSQRKNIPLMLALPVLVVGLEAWQGIFFGGFDWYLLGHSQYENLRLIQLCDIFGVPGLSFIIAMVNGLVADGILQGLNWRKKSSRAALFTQGITVSLIIGSALIYGDFRIKESQNTVSQGPLVGIIQPNVPSAVKQDKGKSLDIVDDLIADSQKSIEAGSELVIWPETIVMGLINKEYLVYCTDEDVHWKLHKKLSDFAADNCYILAGGLSAGIGVRGSDLIVSDQYNSAFLYQPDGSQALNRYDKIHLVPFGEIIPFHNNPIVCKLMRIFTPSDFDYDYSLTPGKEYTAFNVELKGKQYDFSVIICYEDTDAELVRKMAYSPTANHKRKWIADISNDGWYVKMVGDKLIPSIELPQRTVITAFRAVENRIAILRSVNTGISCLIDTNGRLIDGFDEGEISQAVFDRKAESGWFNDYVPIDTRVTFFSKYGSVFEKVLWMFANLLVIMGIISVLSWRKRNR